MKQKITIGTRSSNLAMYQANAVKNAILDNFDNIDVEIKKIETKGDKILDIALSKIGDKGIFTAEIETELLNGQIDFAVHSLKDMPTQLPENLEITAVLKRGEFRDALVSKTAKDLYSFSPDDIVATSSLRRKAQLLHINQNLKIIDIRGNVNTRLKKYDQGHCSAMLMAAAGLQRLDLQDRITSIINEDIIIPAACQGIIAIETCNNNNFAKQIAQKINHLPTQIVANTERYFLKLINAGCKTPFGCYTKFNGNQLKIKAFVSSLNGQEFILRTIVGDSSRAMELVEKIANDILKNGGNDILKNINKNS